MARRIWLLVEWVDERSVFPAYGVVNIDTLAYNETDLNPGKQIYISFKRENPRRAQILRLSDSKRYLQEHKEILERQDQKVKNVLQLCMRTIKEMKSESMYIHSTENSKRSISSPNAVPHVTANSENSESDSETETNSRQDRSRVIHLNKAIKYHQFNGTEVNRHIRSSYSPAVNQRRRSIISSTPLPGNSAQESIKLCFDQGTQTDNTLLQPPLEKIEEMESMLKNLYQRFQSVITQMNANASSIHISDSEHNDVDVSYNEPLANGYWAVHNNSQYLETERVADQNVNNEEPEKVGENAASNSMNGSNVNNAETDKSNVNTLRVRRMSAQTTNNIEQNASDDLDMVPIGNSNAMVPARLLNEMDWNSHTSVTRALLQAIFPRKVLATHSLTGKQSPAFTNKPAKKILDPLIVEDIVKTVSTRCGVPKNLVRNSITIKCTDEAKLYRNRQHRHARQIINQNEENLPPSAPSSDESSAVAS